MEPTARSVKRRSMWASTTHLRAGEGRGCGEGRDRGFGEISLHKSLFTLLTGRSDGKRGRHFYRLSVYLFLSFSLTLFSPALTRLFSLSVVSFVYARRPRCSGRLVLFFQAFITRERKEEAVTKEKEREDRSCDCSFLPFRLLQSIAFF